MGRRGGTGRREFLKTSVGTTAAVAWVSARPSRAQAPVSPAAPPRIRFAAIGLNHGHIYGQVDALVRGGGELVSFFAREPDLAAAFSKRYPEAKLARSEKEILEDSRIHLVTSAAIPNERAAVAIEAMRHGKDVMVDKPGVTTLEQLEEVRRVQAQTRRIYSILYSERLENRATVKAGDMSRRARSGASSRPSASARTA
jgi:predicted dehydrogenase